MRTFWLLPIIFIGLVGCDAHLSVRKDLPLSSPVAEACLDKVIRSELPNGKLDSRLMDGAKYWIVQSDSCSFEIDQEDRITRDGGTSKALVFSKSVITDGLFQSSGKKKIRETEQCIEKVKPVIESKCSASIK